MRDGRDQSSATKSSTLLPHLTGPGKSSILCGLLVPALLATCSPLQGAHASYFPVPLTAPGIYCTWHLSWPASLARLLSSLSAHQAPPEPGSFCTPEAPQVLEPLQDIGPTLPAAVCCPSPLQTELQAVAAAHSWNENFSRLKHHAQRQTHSQALAWLMPAQLQHLFLQEASPDLPVWVCADCGFLEELPASNFPTSFIGQGSPRMRGWFLGPHPEAAPRSGRSY